MKNTVISLYYKEIYPPCFRQVLCRIGIIVTLLVTAGCIQQNDEPEDAWNWDAGNGRVFIRIPLPAAERAVLPLDDPDTPGPGSSWITYYEAILRDHTNQTQYFTGSASDGDSFLVVKVIPGKNYDVLVLAGANVTGQPNGVKVLLASGYKDDAPVVYGQRNIITVPMAFHKTAGSLTSVPAGFDTSASSQFSYKPVITGVKAILQAAGAKTGRDVISTAYRTEAKTYPMPYLAAHYFPVINSVTTLLTDPGSIAVEFEAFDYTELQAHTDYSYHYDLTYYGFSDPASGSSAWSMRRGIRHDLQRPAGGAVLLRYGDYYVHREGSDANDGLSTVTPFKTLARAVAAVRAAGNPAMRTITVLGTLDAASEGASSEPASVFAILNGPAGGQPITITGLEIPDLAGISKPVLDGKGSGKRVLYLGGADTKIVIENITITGGAAGDGGGVSVEAGATFTMQDNAVIEDNKAAHNGGGVSVVGAGGVFIMQGNAVIKDNTANTNGGGVSVVGVGGVFIMQGNAVIENNMLIGNAGGGVFISESGGAFTMQGNAVIKNNWSKSTTFGGGGVFVNPGAVFTMKGDAVIEHNEATARDGGGVYVRGGAFTMQGNAVIKDNTANRTGGGLYITLSGTFAMTSGIIKGNAAPPSQPPVAAGQGNSIYKEAGSTVTVPTRPALSGAGIQYEDSDIAVP